jgi:hypothetical protein
VSPEIQLPSYLTSQGITLQKFPKAVRSFKFIELWFLAAENIRDDLQHVVKTDVMLSPSTTSLDIINVGRGRIPFTDQLSGRAQGHDRGRVGSSRVLPEKQITSKTEYTNTHQGLPVSWYT